MNKQTILDWALRGVIALLSVLVTIIAWQGDRVLKRMDDHETRIITIESSRYTTRDADEDRKALMTELKELRVEMKADLERQSQLIRGEVQQLRNDLKP